MKETFQTPEVAPDTAGLSCTHTGKVLPSPVTRMLSTTSRLTCLINSILCHSATDQSRHATSENNPAVQQPRAPLGHLRVAGTV